MLRAGLATALLLAVLGLARAEPNTPDSYGPTPSLGEQEGRQPPAKTDTPQNDPARHQETLSSSDQTDTPNDEKQGFDHTSPDWWVAAFTFLLVLVAVVQCGVFGLQARRLRQTVETMQQAETRQANDMRASLSVAKASADAIKKSEMANILVRRVELNKPNAPMRTASFKLTFENFGKTPGFIHTTRLQYAPAKIGNEPSIIDAVKDNARGGFYDNGFILPPNTPQPASNVYGSDTLSGVELNRLKTGKDKEQLFVWGEVEFSTIFGETVYDERWISQFAYRINLTLGAVQKNVSVGGAGYWRYYQKS